LALVCLSPAISDTKPAFCQATSSTSRTQRLALVQPEVVVAAHP